MCTAHPASMASATSFSPSATNSPDALRFLGSARARISLTSGLARLVIASTRPGGGGPRPSAMRRPPAEQRSRQRAPAALFAQHQFARFEEAAGALQALPGKFVNRQERRPDRVGGEDQEDGILGKQSSAGAHHLRQVREDVPGF